MIKVFSVDIIAVAEGTGKVKFLQLVVVLNKDELLEEAVGRLLNKDIYRDWEVVYQSNKRISIDLEGGYIDFRTPNVYVMYEDNNQTLSKRVEDFIISSEYDTYVKGIQRAQRKGRITLSSLEKAELKMRFELRRAL